MAILDHGTCIAPDTLSGDRRPGSGDPLLRKPQRALPVLEQGEQELGSQSLGTRNFAGFHKPSNSGLIHLGKRGTANLPINQPMPARIVFHDRETNLQRRHHPDETRVSFTPAPGPGE